MNPATSASSAADQPRPASRQSIRITGSEKWVAIADRIRVRPRPGCTRDHGAVAPEAADEARAMMSASVAAGASPTRCSTAGTAPATVAASSPVAVAGIVAGMVADPGRAPASQVVMTAP